MCRLSQSLTASLGALLSALALSASVAHAQQPAPQGQPRLSTARPPAPAATPAPAARPVEHTAQLQAEARNKALCEQPGNRVFVQHDLGTECIAYFATNGSASRPAVLYFEGDVPAADLAKPNFAASYLNDARAVLQRLSSQTGVRFVFVSRPGTFGSSGNHGSRRSNGEMLTMNAAVDIIKQRLGLGQLVLAGQSGGSTVAAALLTLGRRNVSCAVLGSGLLSVVEIEHAHRVREKLPDISPALLHVHLFDPTDRLDWIERGQSRRIFVLGDPTDTRTPFAQQRRFAERVRSLGHHAVAIQVAAAGELMHGVAHLTLPAAAQCALGSDDASILRVATSVPRPVSRTASIEGVR